MKKLFLLTLAFVASLTAMAQDKTVYLQPGPFGDNQTWDKDGAVFTAKVDNETDEIDPTRVVLVDGNKCFEFVIPASGGNLSFKRNNPDKTIVWNTSSSTPISSLADKALCKISNWYNAMDVSSTATYVIGNPTEPTDKPVRVLALYSATYGKGLNENNPGWGIGGGAPNPLYNSVKEVEIANGHKVVHVTGTGFNNRTANATTVTADYTKVKVAVYPFSATQVKIFGDNLYGSAITVNGLVPYQWNYIDVDNTITGKDYVCIELVGETEFYLDHFYFAKPPVEDNVAPTLSTVTASVGVGSVTLTLKASDDKAEKINYIITDQDNKTYTTTGANNTEITYVIAGLENKEYTFTVKALDENENVSTEKTVTATPQALPTPVVPDKDAADVIALYSNTYTAVSWQEGGWGQSTVKSIETIDGKEVLKFSNFNYYGLQNFETDLSEMDYVHIDVLPLQSMTLGITPIMTAAPDGHKEKSTSVGNLTPGEWNSKDIKLSEFGLDYNTYKVNQFKLDKGNGTEALYVANLYFWKSNVPKLYILGDCTTNGWNPAQSDAFAYDEATQTYTFHYAPYNKDNYFTIADAKVDWDNINGHRYYIAGLNGDYPELGQEYDLTQQDGDDATIKLPAGDYTITIKNNKITITGEKATLGYYVVGTMTNWEVKANYKMTKNEEAETDEYMFESLPLTTTECQFKVASSYNGTNVVTWYPDGEGNAYGQNGEISTNGNYTIYFRPKADGGDAWFYKHIFAAYEAPFIPAELAVEPTADAAEVIAIYSQKYDKIGTKDNNPGWGGGPNPLWTSFEDIVISEHTLKHVVGTGYADRPATSITTTYVKAFVALYPKTATAGKLYADGQYSNAVSFELTPKQWNYVEVPFSYNTNYVGVELVDETEFYLDHFYVKKLGAGEILISAPNAQDIVTVTGEITDDNKSQVEELTYAMIDLSGATISTTSDLQITGNTNAVVIVAGTVGDANAAAATQTNVKGNRVVKNGAYYFPVEQLLFVDNPENAIWTGFFISGNAAGWKYTRTLKANTYNTVVVPMGTAVPEGATAYKLSAYDDGTVSFEKIEGDMAAAEPHLVKVGNADVEIVIESKNDFNIIEANAKATEKDGAVFKANYKKQTMSDVYVLATGTTEPTFRKAANANIGAFRAYLTGVAPAESGAPQLGISFDDGDTTSIMDIQPSTLNAQPIYDLSGRRVQNPTKGLYIVNGKKVVIK